MKTIRLFHAYPLSHGRAVVTQYGQFPVDSNGVLEAPEHVAHEMVQVYPDYRYVDPSDDPASQPSETSSEDEEGSDTALASSHEQSDDSPETPSPEDQFRATLTKAAAPAVKPAPVPEKGSFSISNPKQRGRRSKAKN